jgi:hypothetical protein
MGGGTPAYGVSKAALNALTRMLADELRSARVLVNSVCPGWVATATGIILVTVNIFIGGGGAAIHRGYSGLRARVAMACGKKRRGASALGASRLFRCDHCPHPSNH